jgi:hypothetical protein
MNIENLSPCDMHKPHEGAHALTHSQAILAVLSQSFVRTVGNAALVVIIKLRDTQQGKLQQTKQLQFRYLTLEEAPCQPALGHNLLTGSNPKNKPQNMRALYGMHSL